MSAAATPDNRALNELSLGLFADRTDRPECSTGTRAEQWARHYADHPDELSVILLRARPWLAHVAAEVQRRGLPVELILLPIAESGYDTLARSPRDAAGAWQLMSETAGFRCDRRPWSCGFGPGPAGEPFACTNLLDAVDPAAMRRFRFKLRFDYLDAWRVDSAFRLFFDCPWPADLARPDMLTPGDFAVVKKRAAIESTGDPEQLARMLIDECRYKPGRQQQIGFLSAGS